MKRRAAALLALCALASLAPADSPGGARVGASDFEIVELRDGTTRVDVGAVALVTEERGPADAPSTLEFRPDMKRFRRIAVARDLNRGFTTDAVWLCFTVRSAASARTWILSAGPNYTDSVTAYIVDPDGRVETQVAGAARPESQRRNAFSSFTFRLTVGPGEVKTVYMRFASQNTLRIRVALWDSFEFLRSDGLNTTFVGTLLGVVAAILLSTLFIAISLRERAYLFYLVYLLGLLLYVVAVDGAGSALIWPGNAWFNRRAMPLFSAVMIFGATLFAKSYLELGRLAPIVSAALRALAASAPVFALGLAFLDYQTIMIAGGALEMAAFAAVMAGGIAAVARGSRRAWPFLAAWSFLIAGSAATQLGTLGISMAGAGTFWDKGEQVGALIQVLVMSYGISDAVNVMRVEKAEAQRRSIQLLERANKVKEDFLIATSMEFRSPLYGIVGLSDRLGSLIEGRAGGEEGRLAGLIRAESLRLLNSVANIASYARLRNADIALVAERFSLAEAIDGAVASASYLASGRDIAVEKAVEDVELLSDIRVLEQIVYNLFADTIKRSATGRVRVEARASGDRVLVAIYDSAPRMPEEILSRFLSPGGPEQPEAIGPGLELLVTRLLAERIGGGLAYAWDGTCGRFELSFPREASWPLGSRASGRGTFLPDLALLAGRGARAASPDLSETPSGQGGRGLVLVYDEDPVFLEALKRYLEARGYSVAPTLSADEAVRLAISDRHFDLALLDASGARRAGLEACARIRGTRSLDELPVVVMTDRESAEAVEEAFRAGASDYLPKLSPTELLFARVDTHVALRRAVLEALDTRRRVAELEKLRTLGVMAAGVAHEINTPNNAVIRNLPVVSEVWRELAPIIRRLMDESEGYSVRGWTADELMREFPELLADTYQAGMQIKKIVEDLKDYARDSSGKPAEDVDLSAVAAYASRLLAPVIARSTKRFYIDARPGLPRVRGNYQKLAQTVINVLENALQALPGPDSAVRLRTRADEDRGLVFLECEDEGVGIDPALRNRIFEPFFTTKRDSGGTGLGLSVALGIVRDNGGDIEVESDPGRGTTIRIRFPALPSEE
jgi:signal transduction histidine kinase